MSQPTNDDERALREAALQDRDRERRVVRLSRRQIAAGQLQQRLVARTTDEGLALVHDDGMVSWAWARPVVSRTKSAGLAWIFEHRDWPLVFVEDTGEETVVRFVMDPRSGFLGKRALHMLMVLVLCVVSAIQAQLAPAVILGLVTLWLGVRVFRASDEVLLGAVRDLIPVLETFPECPPEPRAILDEPASKVRVAPEGGSEEVFEQEEVEDVVEQATASEHAL